MALPRRWCMHCSLAALTPEHALLRVQQSARAALHVLTVAQRAGSAQPVMH